ncbi:transcription regulator PAB1642 [Aspergillus terreus]|uniref:Transcription regulator PAB1642 n=1 Tax=Aspergillus terreus TaxID=33178 RepID=A0A5M3YRG4_ASPTE|nr:hypothetical protein ATETN484_0002075400 [Aspergillus terreus]GFF15610.1 transcription regulator PAB1642 [Aspergillus terreus]
MQLTTHLPTTLSPEKATTHPFLSAAGKGLLPAPTLSQWLSQDRLYAQAYVRFIGLLLSKLQLPVVPGAASPTTRAAGILIDAVVNIQRELQFFEDVAREYALDLNAGAGEGAFGPTPITHAYIDMFMAAGSPGVSVLEGLVVLWATEVCYLRAWRYAASFLGEKPAGGRDADGGALRERFIPNWSSAEFEQFVDSIGEVVDAMGESVDGEMLGKCERWWKQVVWLEERFWPDVQ